MVGGERPILREILGQLPTLEWIGNFAYFPKNGGKYQIFHSYCKSEADDAKTHILAHYQPF